jgi:hypothetical protein
MRVAGTEEMDKPPRKEFNKPVCAAESICKEFSMRMVGEPPNSGEASKFSAFMTWKQVASLWSTLICVSMSTV